MVGMIGLPPWSRGGTRCGATYYAVGMVMFLHACDPLDGGGTIACLGYIANVVLYKSMMFVRMDGSPGINQV